MDSQLSTRAKLLSLVRGSLFFICFYAATPYSDNPNVAELNLKYKNLKFLFFTHISLYVTLLTFIVGFIYRTKKRLFKLYNILIPFCFTLEFIVTSVFWILYSIDPELLRNKKTKLVKYKTPIMTELGTHLFPFVLLILEQLDVQIQKSRINGPLIVSFCTLWYVSISIVAKYKNNRYLYPFMNGVTNEYLRFALFSLFILLAYTIQRIYIFIKTRKNK